MDGKGICLQFFAGVTRICFGVLAMICWYKLFSSPEFGFFVQWGVGVCGVFTIGSGIKYIGSALAGMSEEEL